MNTRITLEVCVDSVESAVRKQDVRGAKDAGADLIVLGLLSPEGAIDRARTHELIDLARPLPVPFHRAFDLTRDPRVAMGRQTGPPEYQFSVASESRVRAFRALADGGV